MPTQKWGRHRVVTKTLPLCGVPACHWDFVKYILIPNKAFWCSCLLWFWSWHRCIHWHLSLTWLVAVFGPNGQPSRKNLCSGKTLPSPSAELHHKVVIKNTLKSLTTSLKILKFHYVCQVQSGLLNHILFANIQFCQLKKEKKSQILFTCPIKLVSALICVMLRQCQ